MAERKPYPTDVSDEEWAFVAPYLILFPLDAGQRRHDLREVFNALRYVVRTGCPWRMLPNDLPPWSRVHQQMQRWFKAGCFEAIVHDLRMLLRLADGRAPHPSAAILDSRTLQSTPTSGGRAGYDGAKRKKGSKVHMAVDTLGHLLALHVTPANEQDRDQVAQLAQAVQEVSNQEVTLAYVDQGYTGQKATDAALAQGIALEVVKLPEAKRGFVLRPRRWVVERNFGWAARFRRLARDYERLPQTLVGLHYLAFACLMLPHLADAMNIVQNMLSQHYQEAYSSDYGFESIVVAYRQKLLIERLAQSPPPRIVVEIGCGSELLYETWAKMGRAGGIECWLIIEPAEAFVKTAEASALPNLHVIPDYFQSANKRILNLLPREPDLVICSSLLHEVPSSQDLLTAIHAVMGQRSRLHVNVPNSESLHRRLAKSMDLITDTKVMSARNKALSQHRVYDMNSLSEDLAAAGFRVLDKGGYLIKPFTHAQMEYVAPMIGPAVMDGLFELGMELPELASEIWVEASLGEYD